MSSSPKLPPLLHSPNGQEPDDERGATMTEYALVAVLLVMALIAMVSFMTQGVSTSFSKAGSAFR